ncbi:MAG: DMT family transporter [Calditrichaeota bacterium]|nr:DMT family transporter [Calditrichota bacterium]
MLEYIILLFGVFVTSWSSILIRWMGAVHPLVISFYRLFFSAVVILPFVISRPNLRRQSFSRDNTLFYVLAGFFLALHFFTWIKSLQLTTVGNSIFLESTHPVFALILSYFVLKERSTILTMGGIILAMAGMYLIVAGNFGKNPSSVTGDLLAIVSAFCLAAYLLIARAFAKKISLLPYLLQVYSAAAAITFLLIIFLRINPATMPAASWFYLILLALGPNLIGHSLLNRASRKMPVYLVNLAMQGEAVLATVYAALLLKEFPPTNFYFGSILILIAVSFIFWNKK